MNLNFDFDWLGDAKATGNLLLNVLAAFVVALLLTFADPSLSWRQRAFGAGITAGTALVTKLSRRPSDVAADAKLRAGENPGRRATDPTAMTMEEKP